MWILMAVFSSFFAGITAILAKCGIRRTDSDVATAVRTGVVLAFSWLMAAISGSIPSAVQISSRSLLFLCLSGLATGASWLCYFRALSIGNVNQVVPVDKSSTVLTILLAIIFLQERSNLPARLAGAALLGFGIYLMIEKKSAAAEKKGGKWFIYAALSAVFAALTSILAKIGISGVESNLGTAIRTCVVFLMAWLVVLIKRKQAQVRQIDRRELGFILLSGITTGASWLCYYYAIQNGAVSAVVAIDKLSILVSVFFSAVVFREKLSRRALCGLALMVAGTLLMVFLT